MKPQVWLLVLVAGLYSLQLNAQEIKAVLDAINLSVQDIANQASANAERICESLSECTEQSCLRRACRPLGKYEIETLTCLAVDSNPDCSGSCRQSLSVSTNRSYLRLSPLASESNYELQTSICAQKPVDRKLQQVWQNISKSYQGVLFFGSAEGVLYTYPGRDYGSPAGCVEYDPRKRPWYINSFAVVKSVQILIDTSGSMGNRIGPLSAESCLHVSQDIASELLSTFTNEDRVAISDLSGKPIGSSVQVSLDGVTISGEQDDIRELQKAVNSLKAQDQKIDFKASLTGALQFFGSSADLKVLLVFSNGEFISSLNFTDLAMVFPQYANVVIFFYEMGFGDANNESPMQALKTSLNMTNEVVKDGDNPLLKIRSYFDYLAWLRHEYVNKTPMWVPLYKDAAGFGNVTTATFPAFDNNNRLVGVAGISLIANRFISELGLSVVQEAVSERSPVPSHQKTFITPQMKPIATPNCSQRKLTPVCPRLDSSTPILSFICCANCSGGLHTKGNSSSLSVGVIGGAAAGGVLALLALGCVLFWVYKRFKNRVEPPPATPIPQPEQEEWIMPKLPNQSPSPNRDSQFTN